MNNINVNDWVEMVFRRGQVCTDYMRKWQAAETKAEKFRVLTDTNSGEWLIELDAKGVQLPVDSFCEEYKNFINGKRKVEYPQGYTSVFYCNYNGDITADATLVHVLHGNVKINVPEYAFPKIILSNGSKAHITLEKGSRVTIENYGTHDLEIKVYEGFDPDKLVINNHFKTYEYD